MAHYKLFFDGSCAPNNPGGTAAYGYALLQDGLEEPVRTGFGIIGTGPGMTNNLAEFRALDEGLCAFLNTHAANGYHHLSVLGDSKLVIRIMSGHWKPNASKAYYPAYEHARENTRSLRRQGHRVSFDWVPREMNTYCDTLSKAHLK